MLVILRSVFVVCLCLASLAAQTVFEGSIARSGRGCVAARNALYEVFAPGEFDLDGRGILFIPNGRGGYRCEAVDAPLLPFGAASPTAVDTMAGDDTVTGPHALGFEFVYPGGRGYTTEIDISSNGAVYLESGTNIDTRCCSADVVDFLRATPSFSVYQEDFDPSPNLGRGRIWFDVQGVAGQAVAVITWDDVLEWGAPQSSINMQCQLHEDGRCVLRWFGVTPVGREALVGWSAGGGQPDFGSDDLDTLPLDTGDGTVSRPLELGWSGLPRVGQQLTFEASSLPAMATAGTVLLGVRSVDFDLALVNMQGCRLLTNRIVVSGPLTMSSGAATASYTLQSFFPGSEGLYFAAQAFVLASGSAPTQLGVVASNRVEVTVGSDRGSVTNSGAGIVVQLEGLNTYSCAPRAMPFFNVLNNSTTGELVQSVTFDLSAANEPRVAAAVFDPDGNCVVVGGSGDFLAGDSALQSSGCVAHNAYRGTDSSCGLVYAGTPVSPCDAAATVGWRASNFVANEPQTLAFDFDDFGPGKAFGFDCDVDGGPIGADGLHHLVVTVVTDQRTVTSALVALDRDTAMQIF